MVFYIKLLIGIWWTILEINCQVNWILDTTIEPDHEPLIGKSVRLNCTATDCCADTREWSVEISGTYTVIILDGTSNNIAKYEEDLQVSANQFNLIIKDFKESDLKNYRCRYKFPNDAHTLQMSDGLHYLPSESDMTEVIKDFSSSTHTFSYTLNITSVYPDPACTASYSGDDLTSSMTKTVADNGNFKSVLLQFSNIAHSCSGKFIIQCTVGSYSNQEFANFEPCKKDDGGGGLSAATMGGIAVGATCVGGVGVVAVIIIMITGSGITVYVKKGRDIIFGELLETEVLWKKDGKQIESTHIQGTSCKVVNASEEHEGLYVCTSVKYKQKYCLIVLDDIVYIDGSLDTEFVLGPDQNATTDVVWKKDGSVVKSTRYLGTKLFFTKPSAKDEGLYVCLLKSIKKQFKYYVIVVGTVESFSVNEGDTLKFGKDIPNKLEPTNARWTKDDKDIKSDNIKGSVLEIKNAVKKDGGLYVVTFGPDNLKCQYKITVLRTEETVYASQGLTREFGKIIPDKTITENAQWTKNKTKVEPHHPERTKFKINNTCEKDEGLYVCTFGPRNIKLKYYLIVAGTVQSFSVNEGKSIKFGKDIPNKFAPTNARWTKDDKEIESDNIKGTMIKISNPEDKDGGLYVLTFGPNNMKCQYKLTVLKSESEDGNETVRKLRKKEEKLENGAAEKVPPTTVKDVDETAEKLPHSGRLPPVETPGYIGSSALDRKTYGTPLPPLSSIPVESNH